MQAHNISSDDLIAKLDFKHRSSWSRLVNGEVVAVRQDVMQRTIKEMELNADFINGIYNYKSKLSEVRNIFSDFRKLYSAHKAKGQIYQCSQIIRKAAVFIFESLVPLDLNIYLEMVNKNNNYELSKITCGVEDGDTFVITVFGDKLCVRFSMSKKVGSMDIPVMEGDLDTHALSAIRRHFQAKKRSEAFHKETKAKFASNAKKLSDALLKNTK